MSELTAQQKHEKLLTYWSTNNFVDPATVSFDANGYTVPRGIKYHFMNKPWSSLSAKEKEFYG